MNTAGINLKEQQAAAAFNKQAKSFDETYSTNSIIQYKRKRVRDHVKEFLNQESHILELNSGTGEDAIWFAQQGHHVHATDIAEEMQKVLARKVKDYNLTGMISSEICSFNRLQQLKNKGPFDMIFSNFAGLNCTGSLDKVLQSFDEILKPGGFVTLVILPKFCLWETLALFKGKFKTATRRFFSRNGVRAHLEGEYFTCWYYNPSYVVQHSKKKFELLKLEGLCSIVPPSYIEQFAEKHPKLFAFLKSWEDKYRDRWPWKNVGDYYIISLRKRT
jgi:ubiquinone/menaquinone biosynthesis C-methylase UbiE